MCEHYFNQLSNILYAEIHCEHLVSYYFLYRVEIGRNLIGIENHIAWATPGRYSISNFPCAENGDKCDGGHEKDEIYFTDPSNDLDLDFTKESRKTSTNKRV
jgi:hypothetical protein